MKIKIFRTDFWDVFENWLNEYKKDPDPDNIFFDWLLIDPYINRYHDRITIKGNTRMGFFGEALEHFKYFGAIFEDGTYWYNDKPFTGLPDQLRDKYAAELEQCLKNNTGKYGGSDDYVELDDIVF